MCNDCKECLLNNIEIHSLKLEDTIKKLKDSTKIRITFWNNRVYEGYIKLNDKGEIIFTSDNQENYLCDLVEFIAKVELI
ncbi:hypothetical protein CLPU_49c00020 [Gottschalkia purinilytica]|uniref:Uncharacterized protein n=1 Tax=Gottschalkia purinilytica TaxID=1503 RepID=A0A0L0W625_GOTPU|nr:hypothetical protein [Gottschalkia purinilytica]KNF06954.1 hypothetical protein CLPU_49c00020 [Gottschalkia purinilytica]